MAQYILASASPQRKQLLEWAEVDFEIVLHPTDESFPPHLPPADAAVHIAVQKADAVHKALQTDKPVIAADTIVVLYNQIIGKPQNREEAVDILLRLSGQVHTVITGVCIKSKHQHVEFYDATEVEFHDLTRAQAEFYVDKYKPYDKAGAYAIQEWIGVVGIKRIDGDFYNVMGLPVSRVVQALKKLPNLTD